MGERPLRVRSVQRRHRRFDVENNLKIVSAAADEGGADLLVFPEMFLTGYSLGDDVLSNALDLRGEVVQKLHKIARSSGSNILVGLPERSEKVRGQIHNSAVLIGPEGLRGAYRKMHLVDFGPFEEWAYFTPGDDPFIFELNGMRFGVMICYDIFFPELARYYALMGADVLICISASPSVTRPFFEELMKGRAIENTTYFVYSNMVGMDSRMDFWGGGAIIGPRGDVISKGPYFEEGDVVAELHPEVVSFARRFRPTIRDARNTMLRKLSELGR